MKILALVALVVVAIVVHTTAAVAQGDEALADYTIASWSTRNGLPSNFVSALAQDPSGYLWVGTTRGLARFDGLRFVTSEAIGRVRVNALLVSREGALWVGLGEGRGISRLRDGEVRRYGASEGLAGVVINGIIEDHDGAIWAASESGLYRLTNDRWESVGAQEAFPRAPVRSLRLGRGGAVLAGTMAGLYSRSPGTTRFERIDVFDDAGRGILDIGEDTAGRILVPDNETGFRRLGEPWPPRGVERARGNRVLDDHHGNLWVATTGALLRVRSHGPTTDTSVARTGIFGGRSLFEDRDGNLWIGTVEGLFRLSVRRVTAVTNIGVVSAVDATPDGAVWVVSSEGLLRYPTSSIHGQPVRVPGRRVRAIHSDDAGMLWIVTDAGLVRIADGRPSLVDRLEGIGSDEINSLLPDADGRLWLSTRSRRLLTWQHGRLEQVDSEGSGRVMLLSRDRHGRVWFASEGGRLVALHRDGSTRSFGAADGLGAGPYRVVHEDSHGVVWVGGADGISRFSNDQFVMLRHANAPLAVTSIAENDEGDLWLGTTDGIAVVRRAELDEAIDRDSYVARFGAYDMSDGLAGLSGAFGTPNAIRARDGRIWFVTGRGVSIVNPRLLKSRTRPVPVRIETVTIDDRAFDLAALPARLTPGAERLQIDYAAVDFSSPQKVRYRYQLEGFDAEWIDAGARRQALYTHLPPRRYRFRVVATNLEDPGSEAAAAWDFSVSPRLHQTRWFAALSALVLLAAMWAFWQLRLRHSRRQFALILAERMRLSHELHDTLLQSLVGVALQFEAVSNRLEPASPVRRQLTGLRKQVEGYIREARESIWNLRSPNVPTGELVSTLRESCERTLDGMPGRLTFSVHGTPYRCPPDTEQQLLRIGHEAVLNAARHARADRIQVRLEYESDHVLLRVSDDGAGFDLEDAERRRNGHLGLVTMRERARDVGGQCRIESVVGDGTRIEAVVPTSGSQGEHP